MVFSGTKPAGSASGNGCVSRKTWRRGGWERFPFLGEGVPVKRRRGGGIRSPKRTEEKTAKLRFAAVEAAFQTAGLQKTADLSRGSYCEMGMTMIKYKITAIALPPIRDGGAAACGGAPGGRRAADRLCGGDSRDP